MGTLISRPIGGKQQSIVFLTSFSYPPRFGAVGGSGVDWSEATDGRTDGRTDGTVRDTRMPGVLGGEAPAPPKKEGVPGGERGKPTPPRKSIIE